MLRVLAHFLPPFRVPQQFDPGHACVLRALHLDGGVRSNKARSDLGKIFHRWAKDGNFAERRGFENIMPARRHQRPTYKRAIRQTIQGRQFANTVEKNNRDIARNRTTRVPRARSMSVQRKLRATDKLAPRLVYELGGGLKALRLARRENQQSVRVL